MAVMSVSVHNFTIQSMLMSVLESPCCRAVFVVREGQTSFHESTCMLSRLREFGDWSRFSDLLKILESFAEAMQEDHPCFCLLDCKATRRPGHSRQEMSLRDPVLHAGMKMNFESFSVLDPPL
jgi:hypothetical protein